jgi:hypothetical protein
MPVNQSEALLEEVSPAGNVMAVVEAIDSCCYFYLYGEPSSSFVVKSCWVRNFAPAPDHFDVASMRRGEAPMLPAANCRHPRGAPHFNKNHLKIIWAEEGDAAALTERGEIIAIIPAWSGHKGFHGYARDCIGESEVCWELGSPATNAQFERFKKAEEFWRLWSDGQSPWPSLQEKSVKAVEKPLGPHSNYYAIDGGAWPPKALLRIPSARSIHLVTIGVSIRPQPSVENCYDDPSPHRRIELAMGIDISVPDPVVSRMAQYISAQTRLPWDQFTFLGEGHTIPSVELAEVSNDQLNFFLLTRHGLGVPQIELPPFRGDPINVLWMIPISTAEQQFTAANQSASLLPRLETAGVTWASTFRRSSVL